MGGVRERVTSHDLKLTPPNPYLFILKVVGSVTWNTWRGLLSHTHIVWTFRLLKNALNISIKGIST